MAQRVGSMSAWAIGVAIYKLTGSWPSRNSVNSIPSPSGQVNHQVVGPQYRNSRHEYGAVDLK